MEDNSGTWSYMAQDGLGSVRAEIDATAAVQQSVSYSEYGEPDTSLTGFAFTGEQRDTNGLQYHRARYYDPALGIFPSLDPFEGVDVNAMSLNGYSYVHGDPINMSDPTGNFPFAFLSSITHTRALSQLFNFGCGFTGGFNPNFGSAYRPISDSMRQGNTNLRDRIGTLTYNHRNSILNSSVVIATGTYSDANGVCPPETDVICNKSCGLTAVPDSNGNMFETFLEGLGTLVKGGHIVTHDHYPSAGTYSNGTDAISWMSRVNGYVELWGAKGKIHIPVSKLQASTLNATSSVLQFPSQCSISDIGEEVKPAPFSMWGLNSAQDIVSELGRQTIFGVPTYPGALVYHVYKQGENLLSPNYHSSLTTQWAWIYGTRQSHPDVVTASHQSKDLITESGDSGAGVFMVVDSNLYYAGALKGGESFGRDTWGIAFNPLIT